MCLRAEVGLPERRAHGARLQSRPEPKEKSAKPPRGGARQLFSIPGPELGDFASSGTDSPPLT